MQEAERPASKKRAKKTRSPQRSGDKESVSDESGNGGPVPVADIVNAIHEAENFAQIETNILNKRGADARILLCFVFANEVGVEELRTSTVEAITDALGVKIEASNVAKRIRQNLKKYLSADGVRQKGVPTNYKLNRRGNQAFEKYLVGKKPE